MTDEQRPPAVGNVSEEAARLLRALGADVPPGGLGQSSAPHAATGDGTGPCTCGAVSGGPPECRVCPVCLGLRMLREIRPEVIIGLADLATQIADSLRAFAEERPRPRPSSTPAGEDPS